MTCKSKYTLTLILLIGYLLIIEISRREFHSSYPTTLLVLVLIIFIPAMFLNKKFLSTSIVIGYCGGFVLAYIQGELEYFPPARDYIHNWWGIWNTWCFIAASIGVVLEIIVFLYKNKIQ